MANIVQYGDITPRTAAYVVKELLKRAMPYMVIEKFGQSYPIPLNSTRTAKFRRYFLVGAQGSAGDGIASPSTNVFFTPLSLTPLLEGVTPQGLKLSFADYTVQLQQYGDFIQITDVVEDTHEDPILSEATQILSESAAQTFEAVRYNILKAGTNVFYATGSARASVVDKISLALQRQVTTALNRQNAKFITQVVSSNTNFRTEPVEAAYIALIHPDMETDVRGMAGFIPTKQYGTVTPWENEIGAVERVRYLTSTVFQPFPDAGGTKGAMRSTTGSVADVYPMLVIARDAYGTVPLRGRDSLTPMVVNPKPAAGDPLGQRGSVGWKAWQSAVILQDAFIVRVECAATA